MIANGVGAGSNPFPLDLDELGKRRLASVLVEMYRQKEIARGIINAVRFFLGVEIEAVTAYAGEALALGESEIGADWILAPRAASPFTPSTSSSSSTSRSPTPSAANSEPSWSTSPTPTS